ncbi:MAG TPA: amino acid ABC transporter permease [Acidimicrobiia bacterium]
MTLDTRPDELLGPPDEDRIDEALSPSEWVRAHLISSPLDTALTLIFGVVFVAGAIWVVRYLLESDFTILRVNLTNLMVGRFPRDQVWRPAVALVMAGGAIGFAGGLLRANARDRAREAGLPLETTGVLGLLRRFWPIAGFILLVLLLAQTVTPWLVVGATLGAGLLANLLSRAIPASVRKWGWAIVAGLFVGSYLVMVGGGVGYDSWGGLYLNIFLTVAGITLAFPLGMLLALGRRSSLPALKVSSITYIEFIRGVPLITLLLLGAFALGFFLPDALQPSRTTRILIAIAMFEAAYIAEVVRGGFAAVPKGQVEAAQAVGLSPWKQTRLVVLPQALRATIPAMVGQFISLFKDTTLVVIVALVDILGASQNANAQPEFFGQGLHRVTLPFVAMAFWVGSYTMSREARRLERRLGVGER